MSGEGDNEPVCARHGVSMKPDLSNDSCYVCPACQLENRSEEWI